LPSIRGIKDPLAGFFLFKRKSIDGAVLTPTGYKILLEVLVRGNASQVAEVPYTFKERERGKSNLTLREQLNFLRHLSRLAWFEGDIKRFPKFCLVGASGVLVNMGLLWLLTETAGLFYLVSAAVSIEVSILSNFTLNELWTFRDRRTPGTRPLVSRIIKFNLISAAGLTINMVILLTLTEVLGIHYLISNLLGIAGAMTWNFTANVRWTWSVKIRERLAEQSQREEN
jgi:dolichol-phosphate mannosyltransferase